MSIFKSPPSLEFVPDQPVTVTSPQRQSRWQWNRLFTPVDGASLVVFRIGFGLIAAWWAVDYLRVGRVTSLYVQPPMHFGYYLFDVVRPWPGAGPYLHFAAMAALGVCIAAGWFYRLTTVLFAVLFTLFFLWDRSNYQNHYYLLLLLSWLLTCLPLNRSFAVDALERPELRWATVPSWALWLVRFHIAVPYFFGGLAKLNGDWLAGAAMRDFLALNTDAPWVGSWFATSNAALLFAWGGLVFDLSVAPLLLWRRTRILAYGSSALFHLANHFLFSIHIFPWFMLLATTVFFEPDWPRRLFRRPAVVLPATPHLRWQKLSWSTRLAAMATAAYLLFQLLFPLRHHLYGGDIGWHERGHYFAWRMMLRSKRSAVRFYITDPVLQETWHPNLRSVVSLDQMTKFGRDPEMVLDLAHFLADSYRQMTGRNVEVRALVLTCYNGRPPQLLVDPTVDLAREPRGFYQRSWIMPQQLPLPAEPWNRPVQEWEAHVTLPTLPTVTRGPDGEPWRPGSSALRQ